MECNREEAKRAIKIAERKLSENNYNGAKRFTDKAKTLYPTLDGLEQMSTMIDVYISGSESDWYGILAVDPLAADEEALKKQYKKLALLLHPDKNRFNGAEGAFKLVLDAWSLLSDKATRVSYDQKRKKKEEGEEKKSEPKPPPAAAARENPKRAVRRFRKKEKRARQEAGKAQEASSPKKKKVSITTFWTMCSHCLTYSEHVRTGHLDKTLPCPFCHRLFIATEKFPEMVNGKPFIRFAPPQATCGSTSEPLATGNPHSRFEDLNSTHEAYRLFSRSGRTDVK